ncbi:MAG: hypothetical protein IKP73_18440 [Bacteroidales bacterium]|nr:hypothetical protein [Bacteroidales bacterium]
MKHFLFMLLALGVLCGCSKDNDNNGEDNNGEDSNDVETRPPMGDPPYTFATGNYMDMFFRPTAFEVGCIDSLWQGYERVAATNPQFHINFSEMDEVYWYNPDHSLQDDAHLAKYNDYAKYFGDTAYDKPHYYMSAIEQGCLAPLNSINIVADKDFDEEHPAGTSLNDLFTLWYRAFHSFIKNGHQDIYAEEEYSRYCAKDSTLALSDFKGASLFQRNGHDLILTKRPSEKGAYVFTFTLDFGADPLTGEKVEVPSASVTVLF